jgi:FtsH Extracellular
VRPKPWWLIFPALLLANYLLVRVFFPEPSSVTIPYTVFKTQVQTGNVQDVTSVGDSIQGTFKTGVTYPPEAAPTPNANAPAPRPSDRPTPRTSMAFRTQRQSSPTRVSRRCSRSRASSSRPWTRAGRPGFRSWLASAPPCS